MRTRPELYLSFLALAAASAPAQAGRGTQIDAPFDITACSLGSTSCVGVDVSSSGLFNTAYVYREGIVSFDALLPVGATSSDLASLGSVSFFAMGFSDAANYNVNGFKRIGEDFFGGFDAISAYAFNFFRQGEPLYDDDGFALGPSLQVQLLGIEEVSREDYTFDGVEIGAGYRFGVDPLPGSVIGFNVLGVSQTVRNENGLLVGPASGDSDFFTRTRLVGDPEQWTTPTNFVPLYDRTPGVPEPGTWAMMVIGFAAAGAGIRKRHRLAVAYT